MASQDKAQTEPASETLSFIIEDSRSFVGIIPVYLTVTELKPEEGNLIGYYKVDVPLMSSKNDQGRIILPLHSSMRDLRTNGGVLEGKAHSQMHEGLVNGIVCRIIPEKGQAVRLAITTPDRTIKFKSRYSVIRSSPPDSDS